MPVESIETKVDRALEDGQGLLRLAPTWVPRQVMAPGGRLKLAPQDLYAVGADRGGISERWLSSTTPADNAGAPPDEGLSDVVHGADRFTLRDAVAARGRVMLGSSMWERFGRWPCYSKFFDSATPIPLHLHQGEEVVGPLGRESKPEAYYFPPQLNPHPGQFPYTFFGLEPGTTPEQVKACLRRWNEGDNGILDLSRAYRLRPGTGWLVPPGILHAPGTLATYEPQWGSDVFAIFQSAQDGRPVSRDLLTFNYPPDRQDDLDYIVASLDFEANTEPHFREHHHVEPIPIAERCTDACVDRWVTYGTVGGRQLFSAKELTVQPGESVTLTEPGAYGLVVIQGHGRIGSLSVASPGMIRVGQMTEDELFVTHQTARAGVRFHSAGETEPLVVLRHFGPDAHADMPEAGGVR